MKDRSNGLDVISRRSKGFTVTRNPSTAPGFCSSLGGSVPFPWQHSQKGRIWSRINNINDWWWLSQALIISKLSVIKCWLIIMSWYWERHSIYIFLHKETWLHDSLEFVLVISDIFVLKNRQDGFKWCVESTNIMAAEIFRSFCKSLESGGGDPSTRLLGRIGGSARFAVGLLFHARASAATYSLSLGTAPSHTPVPAVAQPARPRSHGARAQTQHGAEAARTRAPRGSAGCVIT